MDGYVKTMDRVNEELKFQILDGLELTRVYKTNASNSVVTRFDVVAEVIGFRQYNTAGASMNPTISKIVEVMNAITDGSLPKLCGNWEECVVVNMIMQIPFISRNLLDPDEQRNPMWSPQPFRLHKCIIQTDDQMEVLCKALKEYLSVK